MTLFQLCPTQFCFSPNLLPLVLLLSFKLSSLSSAASENSQFVTTTGKKNSTHELIDCGVASSVCVRGLFPWWWQSKWAKDEVTLTVSFISFGKAVPVDGVHLLLTWRRCAKPANENEERDGFFFSQRGINVSISFLYWAAVFAESAGSGNRKA